MFGVVATAGPNGTESDISRLRRENADLRAQIAEVRSNLTLLAQQEARKPKTVANHATEVYGKDELLLVQNTVRLLRESIHTYNEFIKNEADRIEKEGLAEYCGGTNDGCPVRKAVESVLESFGKRADELRENAENMVAAVHKSIKCETDVLAAR